MKKVNRYGPPHFEKEGYVSVWVAISPLSRIPDHYFEERHDDEEAPLTQFCGDFSFGYFDHDFMDTNGANGRARPVEKLIGQCSYASSFAAQAVARAKEQGLEKTQYVVLLYNFKYDPKRTKITRSSHMEFLGSFRYEKDTPK